VVLFGASGHLARNKVLPALFHIFRDASVPDSFFVLGFGRTPLSDTAFCGQIRTALGAEAGSDAAREFLARCGYCTGSYHDPASFKELGSRLAQMHSRWATGGRTLFHLAVPPDLFGPIATNLGKAGLASAPKSAPFRRLMVEKPFGRDLASAKRLNAELLRHFRDEDIFRIDHYLGKNTVQNILVFRFANAVFEPVWNRRYIDHVQLSFSETEGVEFRPGFFDSTGLIRDVLQNHMLQLLCLVAMEPPDSFDPERIRDRKFQLLRSLRIRDPAADILRGRYSAGSLDGHALQPYLEEPGVRPDSTAETWFAAKVYSDNPRWRGVPFFLRGGKRLDRREASISVVFKRPSYCMLCRSDESPAPNTLSFLIQPEQAVSLSFQAKVPGSKMCFAPLKMEFDYDRAFGAHPRTDYETLLLDGMNGDQSLFWRKDGVEAAWRLLESSLALWDSLPADSRHSALLTYPAGSIGPGEMDAFIRKEGRDWI
jgi:glucose-6-phosphate 1-dehydrogenase